MTSVGSECEIHVPVSYMAQYRDTFQVFWDGSYELTNLETPGGQDILQMDRMETHSSFIWGFNSFTMQPRSLANSYDVTGTGGDWVIKMEALDPSIPSMFRNDSAQVTYQRQGYERRSLYLGPGESTNLTIPSIDGWYNGKMRIYIPKTSNDIVVEGATLDYENSYMSGDQLTEYSYWWVNRPMTTIQNVGSETQSIEIILYPYYYKTLPCQTDGDDVTYTYDSSDTSLRSSETLDLYFPDSISLGTLLTPDGRNAASIYSQVDDRYDTISLIKTRNRISYQLYYTRNILGNNIFGIWRITSSPLAEFTYTPESLLVGQTVNFDASDSTPTVGTITSYSWDFGDDTTSSGVISNHEYANSDTYTVTLSVTNSEGKTATISHPVTVRMHEVSLDEASLTPLSIYQGGEATVSAKTTNNGNFEETFNVSLYVDDILTTTETVVNLQPDGTSSVTLRLDTSAIELGSHSLRVEISPVENETNTQNNNRFLGTLQVLEDNTPPRISGVSCNPTNPECHEELSVSATVTDSESGIGSVLLSYSDGSTWTSATMVLEGDTYRKTLPAQVYGTLLQYKIQASDMKGNQQLTDTYTVSVVDTTPPELGDVTHDISKPTSKDDVIISAELSEAETASGIDEVILRYRVGTSGWDNVDMVHVVADTWVATIPPQEGGSTVDYSILCSDNVGNEVLSDIYTYSVVSLGNIEILVEDEGSSPIPGASVSSTSAPSGQTTLNGMTDSAGKITFNEIETGSYSFKVTRADYQDATEPVSVGAVGDTILEIILLKEFSTMDISIVDKDSRPMSGVEVSSTSVPGGQSSLRKTSGSDGRVLFSDAKEGSYSFQISKSGYKTRTETYRTNSGETKQIQITLEKAGIPGYPYESIIIGLIAVTILLLRRRN